MWIERVKNRLFRKKLNEHKPRLPEQTKQWNIPYLQYEHFPGTSFNPDGSGKYVLHWLKGKHPFQRWVSRKCRFGSDLDLGLRCSEARAYQDWHTTSCIRRFSNDPAIYEWSIQNRGTKATFEGNSILLTVDSNYPDIPDGHTFGGFQILDESTVVCDVAAVGGNLELFGPRDNWLVRIDSTAYYSSDEINHNSGRAKILSRAGDNRMFVHFPDGKTSIVEIKLREISNEGYIFETWMQWLWVEIRPIFRPS